ncbi:unnamed protein product [Arabis nemorensis]|uniref:Uncharacterized protein n=1 Tax=Arabis nemorensis TaxID=586526 RepID=A0A565B3Y8_9BRAS|nr:unnamed protein product [Arabis nemorensis]
MLLLHPESDDSAKLSQIETKKLLAYLVETKMNKRLAYYNVTSAQESSKFTHFSHQSPWLVGKRLADSVTYESLAKLDLIHLKFFDLWFYNENIILSSGDPELSFIGAKYFVDGFIAEFGDLNRTEKSEYISLRDFNSHAL